MKPILSPIKSARRDFQQSSFAQSAAVEAIDAYLGEFHRARRELDQLIDWMSELRGKRAVEKAAGLWPPTRGGAA